MIRRSRTITQLMIKSMLTVAASGYNDNDKQFLGTTNAPVRWSLRNEFTILKNIDFSFNLYSYMGHKSLEGYYLNNDNGGSLMTYASILSRRIIGRLKTRAIPMRVLRRRVPMVRPVHNVSITVISFVWIIFLWLIRCLRN